MCIMNSAASVKFTCATYTMGWTVGSIFSRMLLLVAIGLQGFLSRSVGLEGYFLCLCGIDVQHSFPEPLRFRRCIHS